MNRSDRKYHRDFDFKHYYKFVPVFSQVLIPFGVYGFRTHNIHIALYSFMALT